MSSISVALLLGVWSRFGSLLVAAMAILAHFDFFAPEAFLVEVIGRSLGLDVFLAKRDDGNNSLLSRLLRWVR